MDITLEKKLSGFKQIALEKVKSLIVLGIILKIKISCYILQLENILLTIHGIKDLVVSPELIRVLDCFASMTWLK